MSGGEKSDRCARLGHSVYIGLGSNLNDPARQIKWAMRRLADEPALTIVARSSLYISPPWGDENQPDFVNAVVMVETSLSPLRLLKRLQCLEQQAGRVATPRHWGPRVLDLDILMYDALQISSSKLQIPHRYLTERAFVVVPMNELCEDVIVPGKGMLSEYVEGLGSSLRRHLEANDAK